MYEMWAGFIDDLYHGFETHDVHVLCSIFAQVEVDCKSSKILKCEPLVQYTAANQSMGACWEPWKKHLAVICTLDPKIHQIMIGHRHHIAHMKTADVLQLFNHVAQPKRRKKLFYWQIQFTLIIYAALSLNPSFQLAFNFDRRLYIFTNISP